MVAFYQALIQAGALAGQRARVDHQQRLAQPGAVALFREEAIGLEAKGCAGQRHAKQFHHQRQRRLAQPSDTAGIFAFS
jgi:hypothetical protein